MGKGGAGTTLCIMLGCPQPRRATQSIHGCTSSPIVFALP